MLYFVFFRLASTPTPTYSFAFMRRNDDESLHLESREFQASIPYTRFSGTRWHKLYEVAAPCLGLIEKE